MEYAILTKLGEGMPFKLPKASQMAPGQPLRVHESATLLAFERQPVLVFARRTANAFSYLLWNVPKTLIHEDDAPEKTFETLTEFQQFLMEKARDE